MLIPKQKVEMAWTRNKKYYIDKGYEYSGFRTLFLVSAEDLPYGSKKKIEVKCDKCGKIYNIEWRDYLAHKDEEFGDLCASCASLKRERTCQEKYNKSNPSQVEKFKEKRKQTHIEKYGVENAFQSEEFKEKIKQTNLNKYGYEYSSQVPQIKEKAKSTNLKKYGVDIPAKSQIVKDKIKETCLERYGETSYLKTKEAKIKVMKTLSKNGKIPTSKPQLSVYNLLKELYNEVYLNYLVDRCALDCMVIVNGNKIDVEYDGEYWHRNTQKKDAQRNYFLMTQGYKILRIKGNYEIPTKEQLKESIDYLVESNHKIKRIELDI